MNQELKDKIRPYALVLGFVLAFGVIVYGMVWIVYAPVPEKVDPFSSLQINNSIKLGGTTTSTTIGPQEYSCPPCPALNECPKDPTAVTIASTCPTTTTTLYETWIPSDDVEVTSSGINTRSTKPTKIDFKWQKCNPFEKVEVPYDIIIHTTNQTYNMTWINGTTEIINRSSEARTKTIMGGCIVVPTACCRCEDGGQVDAINAKVYRKYYEEVLKDCKGLPIVCPMAMRSAKGCQPAVGCIDGRCRMRN